MRSALVVLLALAASASASPLRLSAENAEAPASQASVPWDEVPMVIEVTRAPCKKHAPRPAGFGRIASVVPASIDALLSKLGVGSDSSAAGVRYDPSDPPLSVADIEPAPPTLDADEFRRLTDLAIAQLMGPPELEGPAGAGLPVVPVHAHTPAEGYDAEPILWAPVHNEPSFVTFVHGPVPPPAPHHAHPHHHHHHGGPRGWHYRARTFAARLQRALRALTPVEALIVAFVLGSGIGSILHFIFMLCLLAIRKCRAATRANGQTQRSALILEGEDAMVQNVVVVRVDEKDQVRQAEKV